MAKYGNAAAPATFLLLAWIGGLFTQGPLQGQAARWQPMLKEVSARDPSTQQSVTVAQLTKIAATAKDQSDEEAAREIEHLELTERLSTPELATLSGELPGVKSKAALTAIGDASVFLEPPKSEMAETAAPDATDQRQIVSRAESYLSTIVPRLPDFYAKRITITFKVAWTPKNNQGALKAGPLKLAGRFEARVMYRNGKEIVNADGAAQRGLSLNTVGTFGPILATVIKDNLHSSMLWHGWEKGPNGAMAVFRFHVPQRDSHYSVSLPMAGLGARRVSYDGEIGIDPDTGTILRLVLRSDPVLGLHAFEHADIMLEYGSVAIGGRVYTCPVRGVSMSTARYREMGIVRRDDAFILLEDVVFTDYHVFRSEMRIVPE